jgi:hypothetical protein
MYGELVPILTLAGEAIRDFYLHLFLGTLFFKVVDTAPSEIKQKV